MSKFTFFSPTIKGLEEHLAVELKELGFGGVTVGRAGASFEGTIRDAYRACLWSRIANRVLLPLKEFDASTPERLYGGVKSIRWSDHFKKDQTMAVDFASSQSQITHTHFGALKTKDAICDQLRSVSGERPSVSIQRPDIRVSVYVFKDRATVSLDLSGESLHRRGYRTEQLQAPMKENLAAGIVQITEFAKRKDDGACFVDGMCGSGTLALEAGMVAIRRAPGLGRDYYGFQGWKQHDPKLWSDLVEEAESTMIRESKSLPPIVGYDSDFRAVRVALANSERAGLTKTVHFEKKDFRESEPPAYGKPGALVVNPPYGERLGETEELRSFYRQIGDTFKKRYKGWEAYVLTGNAELAKEVGLKAVRRHVLFNGPIECRLLKYPLF